MNHESVSLNFKNEQAWRDAATRSLDAMHGQRDFYIGELRTVEHDLKLAIDTADWDAVKSLCEYVTTILNMGPKEVAR